VKLKIQYACAIVYYMLSKSLSRFGAIARRRYTRCNTDGCAVLVIGLDGLRAGRGIDRGVGARSAGSFGSARLERHGGSSVDVSSNWRVVGCMLRGPDGDHLNVYRPLVRESYGCPEEECVSVIAEGGRVLSTESENAPGDRNG